MRWAVLCLVATACGRLDFDAAAFDAVAPPAPIAWWHFDEGAGTVATDAIGQVEAMLVGGPTIPTWVPGHAGTALGFTGTGDEAEAAMHAAFDNLAALTIDGWVRPVAAPPSNLHCLVDKAVPTAGWVLFVDYASAGDVSFGADFASDTVQRTSVGGVVPDGAWTHIAVTWDGSGHSAGIHLYVDGVEPTYIAATEAISVRSDDSGISLTINCNASAGLPGAIDEVRVFDRVLAPAEIAVL